MDYNKFRKRVGGILGLIFLATVVFVKNDLNYYALFVIAAGILIRMWASGYIHKNNEVTIAGPYQLLRHPLYLGSFIAGLGLAFLVNVWQLVILYIPIFLVVYYKKMRLEEEYLLSKFDKQYKAYQETTPLFIPDLAKLFEKGNVSFSWQAVKLNKECLNLLGGTVIISLVFLCKLLF